MADNVQKIREEVERLINQKDENKYLGIVLILELKKVLSFIDSLQEEPVSEELKKVDLKTMFREYVTKIYTEEYSREILDGSATNVDSSDLFGAMCHGFELGLKAQKGEQ